MIKQLKNSLTVRGDFLYCPLPLSLDSYGNCLTDCWHCYFRNLNHIWGRDLKPLDLELLEKKLSKPYTIKDNSSVLNNCLANKKTIRWGNKSDPFQNIELQMQLAPKIFHLLNKYNWTFLIQTRFTDNLLQYKKQLLRSHKKGLLTVMPVISPGLEKDWEILERKRTTPIPIRFKNIDWMLNQGFNIGVNGEPFIPGYHTVQDFEDTLKLLKEHHIPSYNTYNFHFNAFVAKRLNALGIDIEKIWIHNQDKMWKKILSKLLDLSIKYGIRLGCPDFVNSGKNWVEEANTCCGVNVPNPCTYNTHYFKRFKQQGYSNTKIKKLTWDGIGNEKEGESIIDGTCKKMYNLNDII